MLAPNDKNMTNIQPMTFSVAGVTGKASMDRGGQLPVMVTNTGHHLHFYDNCPIAKPEDSKQERTILGTRYLNDMGITVVFQNHTTVLMKTSSVKLSGVVIHQEKFRENLAYIHLQDNGVPRKTAGRITEVNTSKPYPRIQLAESERGCCARCPRIPRNQPDRSRDRR